MDLSLLVNNIAYVLSMLTEVEVYLLYTIGKLLEVRCLFLLPSFRNWDLYLEE